jgi:hypothetical protein
LGRPQNRSFFARSPETRIQPNTQRLILLPLQMASAAEKLGFYNTKLGA